MCESLSQTERGQGHWRSLPKSPGNCWGFQCSLASVHLFHTQGGFSGRAGQTPQSRHPKAALASWNFSGKLVFSTLLSSEGLKARPGEADPWGRHIPASGLMGTSASETNPRLGTRGRQGLPLEWRWILEQASPKPGEATRGCGRLNKSSCLKHRLRAGPWGARGFDTGLLLI